MADIKTEFERECGPDVAYISSSLKGRKLKIEFTVTGNPTLFDINVQLMNGSDREVRDKSRIGGKLAHGRAYDLTGQRARDLEAAKKGIVT